ncbi:MAG TPA: CotH kinase family protein, partial [Pyrinomonadaceae bacterium]|nr:CotH kinase family protein [Pyrinomonadaceae bacterium]
QQYLAATNGPVSFSPLIKTDMSAQMTNTHSSAYIRIPFVVTNVASLSRLTLRMCYDDGFIAFINGNQAMDANAPDTNLWNATAIARNPDFSAIQPQDFDISDIRGSLVNGTNVLGIQGLNISATNCDFLIQSELVGTTLGDYTASPRYFTTPTPGAPNGSGSTDLGPIISSVGFTPALPNKPTTNDNITVTARVSVAFSPITNITMHYQIMFGVMNDLPMLDDGAHGDGAAGDGIYGAVIASTNFAPGQMVRFYLSATDSVSRASRWPLFDDPYNSPQFLGTVIADSTVASPMPIWEWFAADTIDATNSTGTRGAVWFNGQFLDNIFTRGRGGNTSKGSQKFDFNTGYHCKINGDVGSVEEANLNSAAQDPSYIRPPLAFETYRLAGNPASISFQMLMRRNGAADRVGNYVEQVDTRFLSRNGFDPNGAMYKFVQMVASGTSFPAFYSSTDGVEKKTRRDEDNSDMQAVVNALSATNTATGKKNWFFDNINVPEVINYLAVRCITQDADDSKKNW